MTDLKDVSTHFAFGKNWADYAETIGEAQIAEAEKGLLRLLTKEELAEKTFLDIGCGSGLHSLAALRLGVSSVLATDIDPQSVITTKQVLDKFSKSKNYEVREVSVFDLPEDVTNQFDIVYSWGVLHHTGDLEQAIARATDTVAPNGLFAVALYRQTPLCSTWKRIKRWYTHASLSSQKRARWFYISLLKLKYRITGKNFQAMCDNYVSSRGMSFEYDVHDWMGGYPYESITPKELQAILGPLGFVLVRSNVHKRGVGFFGSGCDEFVYRYEKNSE